MIFKSQVRKIQNKLLPDQLAIMYKYKKYMGKKLDLRNPRSFNEKIQWLKLNDRSDLNRLSADKYQVRHLIEQYIGREYLVPLEFETKDINDLVPENFPDYPVIIKTNHDCGGSKIIYDRKEVDWNEIRNFFVKRLKNNYFYYGREWQYKEIDPRIIVETLLLDENGKIPYDYKFYCFNGKAQIIAVDKDRGLPTKSRNWYDMNWNKKKIYWNTRPDDSIIEKPNQLNKIVSLSEKIAQDFHFLRVDWYILKDALFLGELTLHPGSGFVPFEPQEWDYKLGELLKLPL